MSLTASPANATGLPAFIFNLPTAASLTPWYVALGRTTADVATLMFKLPMPARVMVEFENQIRREISADLMAVAGLDAADRAYLASVAWVAFDHRMARHGVGTENGLRYTLRDR